VSIFFLNAIVEVVKQQHVNITNETKDVNIINETKVKVFKPLTTTRKYYKRNY